MSRGLSRTARHLLNLYESDLWSRLPRSQRGASVFAYQRRALAVFLGWLTAHGVELEGAWPEDLHDYRRAMRGTARDRRHRFYAVRRLYRFLYCNQHLNHDPGAVVDLPPRAEGIKNPRQNER